jgi:hypothetical protein
VSNEPRIRPQQAIRPGRNDARNLLAVWFVRKSFYGLVAIGLLGAVISRRAVGDIGVDITSWESLSAEFASPMAGLVLGLLARLGSGFVALWLAYPLVRSYEVGLPERTGLGSGIGTWLDRLQLTRGFRSLRWTHHVRQVALQRLGPSRRWVLRVDPIMDLANITLWVVAVASLIFWTPDAPR